MDINDLEYYKNLIIQKRQEILETDNFTNWFADKNYRNPNEGEDLRDNSHCLSRKNQSKYDENDVHSKAKILQYLLQLDHALIRIRKGNYGTCINYIEEILGNHIEKLPNTRHCPKCE